MASPEDMETMFELIYAYFTVPTVDSTAFNSFRKRIEGSIQNRNARPETAYGDTIQVTMASHHYRARPWSMEMLGEMDMEKSMEIYQERFADASDFTFTFVGNFSSEQMEPLVCAYLATLPTTEREEDWRDVGMEKPEGVVEKFVYAGIEPKARPVSFLVDPSSLTDGKTTSQSMLWQPSYKSNYARCCARISAARME